MENGSMHCHSFILTPAWLRSVCGGERVGENAALIIFSLMINGKTNRAFRDSGMDEIVSIYFLYYSSHSVTQDHVSHDKEQLKENVSRLCPCQTES